MHYYLLNRMRWEMTAYIYDLLHHAHIQSYYNYFILSTFLENRKIVPIAKSNMPKSPEDFRPVSTLSSLSKIFAKLLSIQILHHISSKKLKAANQFGFQAGKSCNTAVLKVMEDIRPAFYRGDLTVMVLIAFHSNYL